MENGDAFTSEELSAAWFVHWWLWGTLRSLHRVLLRWLAAFLLLLLRLRWGCPLRHRHLRHRVWRGVPDGGGGGSVPVRVHVHEERTRFTGRRVQHLLHQHRYPGLSRSSASLHL